MARCISRPRRPGWAWPAPSSGEASAHLHHPAAGLDELVLRSTISQGLESVRVTLTGLATDLHLAHVAVAQGPPWPPPPAPAAFAPAGTAGPTRPTDLPPAAGDHELRADAARRRTPNLVIVAPPATSATPGPSATVLPFRRT
ncbi:hypothetical protein AB0D10_25160 [Kitasatospora sp. NPDC048545]|uniref:hypothetical protein n=1 Tax=Kitasatospora sp. NPDC048545 TaxID=3157208 RepID=UPI00340EFD29